MARRVTFVELYVAFDDERIPAAERAKPERFLRERCADALKFVGGIELVVDARHVRRDSPDAAAAVPS